MNKAIRTIFSLSAILYALCLFALLTGSRGYRKETPSYQNSVEKIQQVLALIGKEELEVTLPHSFSSLPPRTPVTLTADIFVEEGDCLYVKSVYAPFKVYIDDTLLYETGQEDSYPKFMVDPATTIIALPLDGFRDLVPFRIEYLSPKTRSTLAVSPFLVGRLSDIFTCLMETMGIPFIISLLQIAIGLLLAFIALIVTPFERKGVVFLYLGLASLAVGLWCFGECNLTEILIHNPTLLYLLAFMGLYTIPVPLLLFTITIISFHNEYPLRILCLVDLSAAASAFLLQLLGIVGFSQSMYFFHILIPFSLLFLAGSILYEWVRYQNQAARQFFPPVAVLALSAAFEVANYILRFTDVLSSVFQFGTVLFMLMSGVIGGLFFRDALQLKQQKQQLAFEVSLMETQVKEQKKHYQVLLQNAKAVREQRHDLRHQLAVIRSYNQEGDRKNLADYLDTLVEQIPSDQKIIYCKNIAVNAIVSHYAAIAEEKGIACSFQLAVPEHLEQITDSSLCVIFGNLLENAIDACLRMSEGSMFIRMNSRLEHEMLTITMDNSFDGRFTEKGGRLFSNKRNDFGVGTASVAAVAAQHGGGARFEADGLVFLSSVYVRL